MESQKAITLKVKLCLNVLSEEKDHIQLQII